MTRCSPWRRCWNHVSHRGVWRVQVGYSWRIATKKSTVWIVWISYKLCESWHKINRFCIGDAGPERLSWRIHFAYQRRFFLINSLDQRSCRKFFESASHWLCNPLPWTLEDFIVDTIFSLPLADREKVLHFFRWCEWFSTFYICNISY